HHRVAEVCEQTLPRRPAPKPSPLSFAGRWFSAMNSGDKFIQAAGVRTHYLEAGSGDPVILIHGGGAGADARGNWQHLLPIFASAGFRAIAVDMMGFGQNDKPDPSSFVYSQQARVDHLAAFIDALGLKR